MWDRCIVATTNFVVKTSLNVASTTVALSLSLAMWNAHTLLLTYRFQALLCWKAKRIHSPIKMHLRADEFYFPIKIQTMPWQWLQISIVGQTNGQTSTKQSNEWKKPTRIGDFNGFKELLAILNQWTVALNEQENSFVNRHTNTHFVQLDNAHKYILICISFFAFQIAVDCILCVLLQNQWSSAFFKLFFVASIAIAAFAFRKNSIWSIVSNSVTLRMFGSVSQIDWSFRNFYCSHFPVFAVYTSLKPQKASVFLTAIIFRNARIFRLVLEEKERESEEEKITKTNRSILVLADTDNAPIHNAHAATLFTVVFVMICVHAFARKYTGDYTFVAVAHVHRMYSQSFFALCSVPATNTLRPTKLLNIIYWTINHNVDIFAPANTALGERIFSIIWILVHGVVVRGEYNLKCGMKRGTARKRKQNDKNRSSGGVTLVIPIDFKCERILLFISCAYCLLWMLFPSSWSIIRAQTVCYFRRNFQMMIFFGQCVCLYARDVPHR